MPLVPIRDDDLSTKTSIGVRWTSVLDGPGVAGRIEGYKLYQAVGPSAAFTLIYDGSEFRSVLFR